MTPKGADHRDDLKKRIQALPSDHISRVFDFYFLHMLRPISMYTDVLYDKVAEITFLLTNNRRKITNADRDETIRKLFQLMVNEDRAQMPVVLLEVGIERNILIDVITEVLHAEQLPSCTCEIEPLKRHLRVLMNDLLRFREQIYGRYVGLTMKKARTYAWGRRELGLMVEDSDAEQNHALAVLRALDKFDAQSGTLTKFVAKWMRNAAHSVFTTNLGESYSVTRNVRKKMTTGTTDMNNHAVPIDTEASIEQLANPLEEEAPKNLDALETVLAVLKANNMLDDVRWAALLTRLRVPMTAAEVELLSKGLPKD